MVGQAFSLARWFDEVHNASGPEEEGEREAVLEDVYAAVAVAVEGKCMLAKTPKGAVMLTREEGEGLVWFDAVSDERWERVRFWMNATSVSDLCEHLGHLPQVAFEEIFMGARVKKEKSKQVVS